MSESIVTIPLKDYEQLKMHEKANSQRKHIWLFQGGFGSGVYQIAEETDLIKSFEDKIMRLEKENIKLKERRWYQFWK